MKIFVAMAISLAAASIPVLVLINNTPTAKPPNFSRDAMQAEPQNLPQLKIMANGQIGTRDFTAVPPNEPAIAGELAEWYTPNNSFTRCMETRGPAARLDELNSADTARTRDFKDTQGKLSKVEVIVDIGGGQESVNTYYKSVSVCMAENVNRYQNLADQYR